jgi:hypothetical protein
MNVFQNRSINLFNTLYPKIKNNARPVDTTATISSVQLMEKFHADISNSDFIVNTLWYKVIFR